MATSASPITSLPPGPASLPPGYTLEGQQPSPSTNTIGPVPGLTPANETAIAQAISGGNPVQEVANRYLTIPAVKALLRVNDAIKSAQELTEQGREQHPIEAKLGDLSASIEGLLVGQHNRPDEAIGSGNSGILNNPVTTAVMVAPGAPEDTAAIGSKIAETAAPMIQKVRNASGALTASAKEGAQALEQAATVANNTPIDGKAVANIAHQIEDEGAHGGTVPKVIKDFLTRLEDDKPITYKEGRQFYVHSGSLSSAEKQTINGPTQKLINQFNSALDDANHAAAEKAGVGEQYRTGMEQTRLAANRSRAAEHLGNIPTVGKAVRETGAAAKDISAGAKVRVPPPKGITFGDDSLGHFATAPDIASPSGEPVKVYIPKGTSIEDATKYAKEKLGLQRQFIKDRAAALSTTQPERRAADTATKYAGAERRAAISPGSMAAYRIKQLEAELASPTLTDRDQQIISSQLEDYRQHGGGTVAGTDVGKVRAAAAPAVSNREDALAALERKYDETKRAIDRRWPKQ